MPSLTDAKAKATQDFVPIKEIRDGLVVLKNGGLRLVLMVSSINFALKSGDEQTAILMQFQNFLNSLDFDVQIFVQSRKLDIKPYLDTLEERLVAQNNELMKIQTREYIGFIKKFTETTDIMSKGFFVVVPYSPPIIGSGKKGGFGKFLPFGGQKEAKADSSGSFEEDRTQLEQRAGVVAGGFGGIGLRVTQLGTEELVELYFKMFNLGEGEMPPLG